MAYNIFISHSWKYDEELKRLENLLEKRGYFNVNLENVTKDNPINSINAAYIKTVLRKKIENAQVVLAISGVYASYSAWMEWELDTALKCEIPIIGVFPYGKERTSNMVYERSIEDVSWRTESIVAAIRRNI